MGDLEVEIMELVWKKANPTVTVREIYELLRLKREIAYTTVMTTMVRLAEKGILRIVDKVGLANLYTPAQTREEFIQVVVGKILDIFFEQFPEECEEFFANRKAKPARKSASSKKR